MIYARGVAGTCDRLISGQILTSTALPMATLDHQFPLVVMHQPDLTVGTARITQIGERILCDLTIDHPHFAEAGGGGLSIGYEVLRSSPLGTQNRCLRVTSARLREVTISTNRNAVADPAAHWWPVAAPAHVAMPTKKKSPHRWRDGSKPSRRRRTQIERSCRDRPPTP